MTELRVLGGPLHGELRDIPDKLRKVPIPYLPLGYMREIALSRDSEELKTVPEPLYKVFVYERSRFRFPHAGREIEVLVPEGSGDAVKEMYLIQLIQGG